jgi:hypothetical protein
MPDALTVVGQMSPGLSEFALDIVLGLVKHAIEILPQSDRHNR